MPDSPTSSHAAIAIAPPPGARLNSDQATRAQEARRATTREHFVSLAPLAPVAVLYLAGIALNRALYLPPGPLLLSLFALAGITTAAIYTTPRLAWLPMTLLWAGLGAWSAAMEPQPVLNPQLAEAISAGLIRTIAGKVITAEPLRSETLEAGSLDQDPDAFLSSGAAPEAIDGKQSNIRQQADVEVLASEVLTSEDDRMQAIQPTGVRRVRMELYWPTHTAPRELSCGQMIRATVRLASPQIFLDPGVWNRAEFLAGRQIAATASLDATRTDAGIPRFEVLPTQHGSPACLLDGLRRRINTRLTLLPETTRSLPAWLRVSPADAAMLTALLTGDRNALTRGIRSGFERTGSFHLVVVSGLHLAIVAGCIFALARRMRIGNGASTLLTIATALVYAVFTGFGVPVQRSFWMVTLYLLGRLLYRDRSPLNAIGLAVLCLAAASPQSIFDASFQMTLLAVAAIAGVAAPLLEPGVQARLRALHNLKMVSLDARLPPRIVAFRVLVRLFAEMLEGAFGRWAAWRLLPVSLRVALRATELLCVSAIVELALALPMAIYFHRITVYALPVNLFLLPLLGLMLPVAMILLIVLAIWPAAALIPAAACVALLHAGVFVVGSLSRWTSADLRLPDPGATRTLLALLLFVVAIALVRFSSASALKHWRWAGLAALAGMAALAVAPSAIKHPHDALLFEAIDVGQGDSLLLITPDGHTLLMDGGGIGLSFLPNARAAASGFDTGEDVVSPTLWARGIHRLDAVALSHGHHDHMGGLPAILRNFRPSELWVGHNPPDAAYEDLLRVAVETKSIVRSFSAGQEFSFGDARVRVIAPSVSYRPGRQAANNDSLVMQMSYDNQSVLLTGDAEKAEEAAMQAGFDLGSTVLKVGHHGSRTSTQPAFLAAVHPQWAVISCGRKNRFGHPRQEILEELAQAHVRTYRTDSDGAVCFTLSRHGVTVEPRCGLRPSP